MTTRDWLSTDRYLAAIERDASIMSELLRAIDLDTEVPSCPDWTVRDLVVHTGIVHRQKAETVRGGWVDGSPPRPDPPGSDLSSWFDAGVLELLDVLSTADLSRPSWTWCNHDHTAKWWARRMAHETTIHAADAVLASGDRPRLDQTLAADGVDEILIEMMTDGPPWGTVDPADRVVAIDIGEEGSAGRWVLRTAVFSGTSPTSGTTYEGLDTFVIDSSTPDATVAGDASTIDLWLWGRGPLGGASVSGDADLVHHVRRVAAEATG